MQEKQPYKNFRNNRRPNNNRGYNNRKDSRPPQPRVERVIRREVTLQSLLENGAHFGSNTSTWHPKTAPFIFGARKGKGGRFSESVYIIDLEETLKHWERARTDLVNHVAAGGVPLMIGTKPVTEKLLAEEAGAANIAYVNSRWLGGTLTNFGIVKRSISKLNRFEKIIAKVDAGELALTKKEVLTIKKDIEKLLVSLGGLRNMKGLPSLLIVLDAKKDHIVIQEARRLKIPVMALLDTDVNPENIDIPIPANDDSNGSQSLFIRAFVDAIKEGQEARQRILATEAAAKAAAKEQKDKDTVKASEVTPASQVPSLKKKANNVVLKNPNPLQVPTA